jgi:hypothetical protein
VSTASISITKQIRERPILFIYVTYLTAYNLSEKHKDREKRRIKENNTSVHTVINSFETAKNIIIPRRFPPNLNYLYLQKKRTLTKCIVELLQLHLLKCVLAYTNFLTYTVSGFGQ